MESKLEELNRTLQGLIEINQTLVAQNIKLSDQLYGKVKLSDEFIDKKELYYCKLNDDYYYIHGPGTYDNKSKIKEFDDSEWDKSLKAWKIKTTLDSLLNTFVNIIHKDLLYF